MNTDLVVKVVVPVEPVLESQVAEDVGGLRDENLSDRILERFLFFFPAILGNRLGPKIGRENNFGWKKHFSFQKLSHRGANMVEDNHFENNFFQRGKLELVWRLLLSYEGAMKE
jgi:hypothetical protein